MSCSENKVPNPEVPEPVTKEENILKELLAGDTEAPSFRISGRRLKKKKVKDVKSGKGTPQDFFDVYGDNARAQISLRSPEDNSKSLYLQDVSELVNWVLGEGVNLPWCFIKNKPLISKVVLLFVPGLSSAVFLRHRDLFSNLTTLFNDPRTVSATSPSADPMRSAKALLTCSSKRKQRSLPARATLNGFIQQAKKKRRLENGKAAKNDTDSSSSSEEEEEGIREEKDKPDISEQQTSLQKEDTNGQGHVEENKQMENAPFPPSHYVLTEDQMTVNEYPKGVLSEDGITIACPKGYVMTQSVGSTSETLDMVAVDCEMCVTAEGLELTRVTLVNKLGEVLYDHLVQPTNPILDYNTQYSGITAKMLIGVTKRLEDVQRELLTLISAETILIGHALQNDLKALKLIHRRNIDTSVIFPHPRGPPYRPALRILCSSLLDRTIQNGKKGHDSREDARAAMDLALLKISKGPSFGEPKPFEGENLINLLHTHNRRCSLIDRPRFLHRFATGAAAAIPCTSDSDAVLKIRQEVRSGTAHFIWAQLSEVEICQEKQAGKNGDLSARSAVMAAELTCKKDRMEGSGPRLPPLSEVLKETLKKMDQYVGQVHETLPPNTLLMVASGHGDTSTVRKLNEMKWKKPNVITENWTEEHENILRGFYAIAKTGLLFATVRK